jgi:hypothetical protein
MKNSTFLLNILIIFYQMKLRMCAFLLISLTLLTKANGHEFKVEIVKNWEKEHMEYEYLFAIDPSNPNPDPDKEPMKLAVYKATELYELKRGIRTDDEKNFWEE